MLFVKIGRILKFIARKFKGLLEMMRYVSMKVLFCGFMGSGKSYALDSLSKLAPTFKKIDLDEKVLDAANHGEHQKFSTLGDLINSKGWEYFRNLESEVLNNLLQGSEKMLLALGGGSLNPVALKNIESSKAHLIWLNTSFELCLKRIKDDGNRPLSKRSEPELKKLFEDRKQLYQNAHEIIDPQEIDWKSWWEAFHRTNI